MVPLGPGPMEVDGAEQAPGDGAVVGEATDSEETDSLLAHDSPVLSGTTVGWPIVCGGLVSCWQACGGVGGLRCGAKQTD